MQVLVITFKQNMEIEQNFVTQILTAFVIYIITEDFYRDFANDVGRWFDTSNYDKNDDRPLPIGKNRKVIGLFKDELGGKIMKVFVGVRVKTWAYLMDITVSIKKQKK